MAATPTLTVSGSSGHSRLYPELPLVVLIDWASA
jgi:hypothetical protein